jgi:hypothetical protein
MRWIPYIAVIAGVAGGIIMFSQHRHDAAAQVSWQVIESTVSITVCGNNIAEEGEECDGDDLRGETCASLGFGNGPLSCTSACTFDTSACTTAPPDQPPGLPATVTFSGRAYPFSSVTLLRDAQLVATTVAGGDANLNISLTGLSPGSYVFSLHGKDSNNMRSRLTNFAITVTSGVTTNISGIFIAPTIALDKIEVRRGDNITVFGQTAPNANVTISVHSPQELLKTVTADGDGMYLHRFDTSPLTLGEHAAKSRASGGNLASEFSNLVGFTVGTRNVLSPHSGQCPLKGDFNGDCRVDLIDFSILAFWYRRPNPPAPKSVATDGPAFPVSHELLRARRSDCYRSHPFDAPMPSHDRARRVPRPRASARNNGGFRPKES